MSSRRCLPPAYQHPDGGGVALHGGPVQRSVAIVVLPDRHKEEEEVQQRQAWPSQSVSQL